MDVEERDAKLKRTEAGKGLPKVKLPLLEGKSKYLQFVRALHEWMKDFTNKEGVYEGDHINLLKLIKEAMCTSKDKEIVGNMFSLDEALGYLNGR